MHGSENLVGEKFGSEIHHTQVTVSGTFSFLVRDVEWQFFLQEEYIICS